ncbi:cardiolipin synthase [Peptoclostridium litorale DSM 5388]|uniref:Cardiolipin synthase n=1 Tax=Peptoclostridium litorale DSM 5388 TaxID=1121324 RepID=A0A069RJE3_PEPLI|nr:cardiolipin synthase [Peptoclostridium litorale]KDR94382.1 cardiolipin synthase Cls [Peptoclostridium litorale DSM 5388]SIO24806.1 cardiolipin synthase [Peptoclostridium litorale DSM 5388]
MDAANIITIILGFFILSAIFASILIFLENRDPSRTLAWLLVLMVFPVVGFMIYLFFGQNIKKKKIFKMQKLYSDIKASKIFDSIRDFENLIEIQKQAIMEDLIFVDPEIDIKRRIMNLLLNTGRSPFTLNNKIKILKNGDEKFECLIEDISNAKEHIHMEYYIIKDSQIGNRIKDVLIRKSREGVAVRILYDDVGCWNMWFKRGFFKQMQKEGIQVEPFLPVFLPFLNRKLNYRNHRKIVVIDGKIGYVGGINIGDEYLGRSSEFGFWRDTHMKIEGEAVYMLQLTFLLDWYFSTKHKLFDPKYFPPISYCGHDVMQVVASGPDSNWEAIHKAYFTAITQAKKAIYIQTPYFIPDESLLMALKTASLSGVDVRIMFPGKPDHKMVYYASFSYFEAILKAGGRVFIYDSDRFIHAKVMIVDDEVASLGTANMDLRSFMINFEINGFIYSKDVVLRLKEDFMDDQEGCREITIEEYNSRGIVQKLKESTSRLFSPML